MVKPAKLLVFFKILLFLVVLSQGTNYLLSNYLSDDAYYYFVLAENFVQKGCLCFNDGLVTNGFHPLYFLVILPFFLVGGKNLPIIGSLFLLNVFDIITGIILFKLFSEKRMQKAGLIAMFLWYFNPRVFFTTMMGVESSLKIMLVSLVLYHVLLNKKPNTWFLGALLGLVSLARLDGIILTGLIAIVYWFRYGLKEATKVLIPPGLVYFIWMSLSKIYVGSFLPISGVAVKAIILRNTDKLGAIKNAFTHAFFKGAFFNSFGFSNLIYLLFFFVLVLVPLFYWYKSKYFLRDLRLLILPFMWVTLESFYYIVIQNSYRDWYAHSLYLFCVMLFGVSFSRTKWKNFVFLSLIISLSFSWGIYLKEGNYMGAQVLKYRGALVLDKYEKVGSFNTGIPQYYSNTDILNLDGVVNPINTRYLERGDIKAILGQVDYVVDELDHLRTFNLGPGICEFTPVETFNISWFDHNTGERINNYGIYRVTC